MSNQIQNPKEKKYDLAIRTSQFSEKIIIFVKILSESIINRPLISQLIRCSTSIGANYMEADGAESKKDFYHKISICKKESKETMYWLHIIAVANPSVKEKCRDLWKEVHELVLIFSSIANKTRTTIK